MTSDWLDNPPDRNPMSVSMWDLFDRDLFIRMREEGYIRVQTLDNSVLAIANYSEKAQYEQEWNPVTLQCRGLIFDIFTQNVVARPFPKFFNWDDSSQPYPPQSQCVLMPKMDGSLGVLYYHDDGYKIATRGSFTSDQAVHATGVLRETMKIWAPLFHIDATYLFEVIYPANRIVVDYHEWDTLVLLDVIDNRTGESRFDLFDELDWPDKVSRKNVIFNDSLIHEIPQGEEGFVLYWPYQNMRVKMKSAEYLSLHKMIFGLNARVVWERIGQGDTWETVCDGLPDEFHQWVKDIVQGLEAEAALIKHAVMKEFKQISKGMTLDSTRKDFAGKVSASPNKKYLFMLFDGKSIDEAIWNSLKPIGVDTIKVIPTGTA